MAERRTEHQNEEHRGAPSPTSPAKEGSPDKHRDRTAGTNRDFDETDESRNQGHGHPREERGRAG
jgi:hypothetical protein